MSDLDDILNGVESTPEPEVASEPEVKEEEASTGEPEPEKVPETAEKQEDSTPEPKKSEDSSWQFEAYKDEKRKRQELERKLAESAKEPAKVPDVFENQEGYTKHIQDQISQSQLLMKAEMSQFHADREFGKDVVSKKLEAFREMVAETPALQQQVLSSYSPIHEAIDIVDKAEKLKQIENVDAWEAKKTQELESKIRAEMEGKYKAESQKRESVTPSLNNQASSSNTDKIEDSLSALLGGR